MAVCAFARRFADGVIRRLLATLVLASGACLDQRIALSRQAPASVTRARTCQDLRPGQQPP